MDNFDFFGPNLPKNGFRFKNVGVRIDIVEIPCVSIFRKNGQLTFLAQMCSKMGWNFKNLSPDSESAPPRYHVDQFSVNMDHFEFFGLN